MARSELSGGATSMTFSILIRGMLIALPLALVAGEPLTDASLTAWVDQRIKECEPKPAERRFDEIGWVQSIREAERLAKEHARPVFLFTHDGRMGIGRC